MTESTELEVERLKGELARAQAELDNELKEESADAEQDRASRTQWHSKLIEISGGAVERSRDSAKFVQTAAAALVTAYVALLG